MKKVLLFLFIFILFVVRSNAQTGFSLNAKAWTTNYYSLLIYTSFYRVLYFLIEDPNAKDIYLFLMPNSSGAFPVGIEKNGFESNEIYGPYHSAFSSPFKHLGDYSIGLDGTYKWNRFGVYVGVHFKCQEITFKKNDNNLRGFYFQPRAGVVIGDKIMIESGVFYDFVVGASGSLKNAKKSMLSSGLGLDYALSWRYSYRQSFDIRFMMSLHNFLNDKCEESILNGMYRRMG